MFHSLLQLLPKPFCFAAILEVYHKVIRVTGSKQYGIGVSALAVTLLTLGMVSVDRTQKLMNSLGIPISKGKIQDALEIAAEKVKPALDLIKTMILLQFVLHFDETGVRVAGKLNWLHCACTDKLRYYAVEEKRGKEGIKSLFSGNAFQLVVDWGD